LSDNTAEMSMHHLIHAQQHSFAIYVSLLSDFSFNWERRRSEGESENQQIILIESLLLDELWFYFRQQPLSTQNSRMNPKKLRECFRQIKYLMNGDENWNFMFRLANKQLHSW
jgi:hypothetical protein